MFIFIQLSLERSRQEPKMLVAIGSTYKILELKINFPAKKKKKYPKTRERKLPSELSMISASNTSSHWKKHAN